MTTTGLTDDEIRVRIAQACGWKIPDHCITKRRMAGMTERQCKGAVSDFGQDKAGVYHDSLPDYLNDLNAMHAAEKSLPESLHEKHIIELEDQAQQEVGRAAWAKMQPHIRLRSIAMLPVRRRAIAFLAMLPEPEAGR